MPTGSVVTVYHGQLFKGNPAIKGYDPIISGPVEITLEPVAGNWMLIAHRDQTKVWEDVINASASIKPKIRENFIQWTLVRVDGAKNMFGFRIRDISLAQQFMEELTVASTKLPPSNEKVVRIRLPSKEILACKFTIETTMVQVIKEIATLQQFDSSSYALGLGVSNESPHFIKPSMTVGELGPKTLSVLRRRKSTVAAQEKPKISVESSTSPMLSVEIILPSEEHRLFTVNPSILLPELLMLVCDSIGLHPDRHEFDLPIQNQSKIKLQQLRLTQLTLKEKEGPVETAAGTESTDSGPIDSSHKHIPKKRAPLPPSPSTRRSGTSTVVQAHMKLRSSPLVKPKNQDDVNNVISSLLIEQAVSKSMPPSLTGLSPTTIKRTAPEPPGKSKRSAPPPPSKEEKKTEPQPKETTSSYRPHLHVGIPLPSMVKQQPSTNNGGSKNNYSISPTVGRRQSREKPPVLEVEESTDSSLGGIEGSNALGETSSPSVLSRSTKQPSRKAPSKPVPYQSPKMNRQSDASPQVKERSSSMSSPRVTHPSPVHSTNQPSRKAPSKPPPYQSPKLNRANQGSDLSPQIKERSSSMNSPRVIHSSPVHSTKQPSRKAPSKPPPYQSPKLNRPSQGSDLSPQVKERSSSMNSPRVAHSSPVHSAKQPSRKAPSKPPPYQSPKLNRPVSGPVIESVPEPVPLNKAHSVVPTLPQKPISFKIPPPPPKKNTNQENVNDRERTEERKEQEEREIIEREKEISSSEEEDSDNESTTSEGTVSAGGYDITKDDINDTSLSSNEETDGVEADIPKTWQESPHQKEDNSDESSSDSEEESDKEEEEDNNGGIVLLKHEQVNIPDELPYIPSPPISDNDDSVFDNAIHQLTHIEPSVDTIDEHNMSSNIKELDNMVASLRTLIADTCEISGTDHVDTSIPINVSNVNELAPPPDSQPSVPPPPPPPPSQHSLKPSSPEVKPTKIETTSAPPPPPPPPPPASQAKPPPPQKKPPPPLVKPKPKTKVVTAESNSESVEDELKLKLQQRQQKIKEESQKNTENKTSTTSPEIDPAPPPNSTETTSGGDMQSQLQMLQQQMLQQQMMQLQQQFQQLQQQLMTAGGGVQFNPLLMQQQLQYTGLMPSSTPMGPYQMMPAPQMMPYPGVFPPSTGAFSPTAAATHPITMTTVAQPYMIPVAQSSTSIPAATIPENNSFPVAPSISTAVPPSTSVPIATTPENASIPVAPPTDSIPEHRTRKISEADRRSVALGNIEDRFDSLMEEVKEVNLDELLAKVTDIKEPESAYTGMTAALIEAMKERRRHFSTDGSFTAEPTNEDITGDDTTNEWAEEDL